MRIEKHLAYLDIARNRATLTTCLRRGYGAVLVKGDRIISAGYNGASSGEPHCCDTGYCWREQNGIPSGQRYEECVSTHAEENCMYRASWDEKQGATLYLFGLEAGKPIDSRPCKMCIKRIKNNGIAQVICGNADGTFFIINL